MRSPCLECPDRGDYDRPVCRGCARRWAYVRSMEGMTHSLPVELAHLGGAAGGGGVAPESQDYDEPAGQMKICSKADCAHGGRPQTIGNFGRHPKGRDGRRSFCKDCCRKAEQARAARRANKTTDRHAGEVGPARVAAEAARANAAAAAWDAPPRPTQREDQMATETPANPPGTKVCNKVGCIHGGAPQPVANFHRHPQTRDGLDYRCKDCMREAGRKRNEALRLKRQEKRQAALAGKSDPPPDESERKTLMDVDVLARAGSAASMHLILGTLFAGREDLISGLQELAARELRTPENQLIYLVQRAVRAEGRTP